jgi:hypothetical protein
MNLTLTLSTSPQDDGGLFTGGVMTPGEKEKKVPLMRFLLGGGYGPPRET